MENSSRVFGSYAIKRKLGSGGMASVFLASHQESQQEVAIKILHEHYSDDPHVRKRLEHEARIVMRLKHPRIVPIIDYGEAESRPYLVMPYYSGGSLASFFSKPRTVKHESSLKLLKLLADGLDYAHSQQVVHRDFKLENILVAGDGLPAISDFGIAQSAHTTRITVTGQILGTPQYLAPENLDADGRLNYRADLYALAVMAYLMLTGYFPFSSLDPLKLAIMHRTEYAPAPSQVNPNLPNRLNPVLERGLAKNPADRYPTAAAFVEALEEAFEYAALVTTQIFVNAMNPVPPTQPDLSQALKTPPLHNTQAVLQPETIPAVVAPAPIPTKRQGSRTVVFLLVLLLAGTGLASFIWNNNLIFSDTSSNPENTVEAFLDANLSSAARAEETQISDTAGNRTNPIVFMSETATRTVRPSLTPQPTASHTATNTSAPTSVPATNTPRPTSVPPTNPPAPTSVPPTNPPDNGGGGIVATVIQPIVEPIRTAVPCVPVPLVRDCD